MHGVSCLLQKSNQILAVISVVMIMTVMIVATMAHPHYNLSIR
jgi:hypothetical protein